MAHPLLVFLHLAKTGGRTMDTVLRNTYGPGYVQAVPWSPPREMGADGEDFILPVYDPDDFRRLQRLCPWMRAVGGHSLTMWSQLHTVRPVRYFAFMREPTARAASHYQYHVATAPEPLDWETYCDWPEHYNSQVRFFSRDADPDEAIRLIKEHGVFIGLLERFEESLLLLQRLVAPELVPYYMRRNTAGSTTIAKDLMADPDSRQRLREMNSAEFPLHDFVVNELWPQYEQAYGPTLAEDAARLKADPGLGFRHWHDRSGRALHKFWVGPWQNAAWRRYGQG